MLQRDARLVVLDVARMTEQVQASVVSYCRNAEAECNAIRDRVDQSVDLLHRSKALLARV